MVQTIYSINGKLNFLCIIKKIRGDSLIKVSAEDCKFTFSRSSGAGGQNVNKLNTKVTMFWDMGNSNLCNEAVKKRFREKYKRFLVDGGVVITSQRFRKQSQNIDDCLEKLERYLNEVRLPPKLRRTTKPTKSSVKKRLDGKNIKSKLKKMRREKF
ncbi:MAG: ribosome-associated protein [Bacteriovoracaceae bacterium]|jgi:ribosome-associated protein